VKVKLVFFSDCFGSFTCEKHRHDGNGKRRDTVRKMEELEGWQGRATSGDPCSMKEELRENCGPSTCERRLHDANG